MGNLFLQGLKLQNSTARSDWEDRHRGGDIKHFIEERIFRTGISRMAQGISFNLYKKWKLHFSK